MTDKKTGGPAFPKTPFVEIGTPQNGMTLRDYFAAKAMQAYMSDTSLTWEGSLYDSAAAAAYRVADAMMEAREA